MSGTRQCGEYGLWSTPPVEVDTFTGDPISSFKLQSPDFSTYGRMIGACRFPSLFVPEGGHAAVEIGVNVLNVLTAFEGR
jgi:acetoin utilization deacetylase AcuC-like enzyme